MVIVEVTKLNQLIVGSLKLHNSSQWNVIPWHFLEILLDWVGLSNKHILCRKYKCDDSKLPGSMGI